MQYTNQLATKMKHWGCKTSFYKHLTLMLPKGMFFSFLPSFQIFSIKNKCLEVTYEVVHSKNMYYLCINCQLHLLVGTSLYKRIWLIKGTGNKQHNKELRKEIEYITKYRFSKSMHIMHGSLYFPPNIFTQGDIGFVKVDLFFSLSRESRLMNPLETHRYY